MVGYIRTVGTNSTHADNPLAALCAKYFSVLQQWLLLVFLGQQKRHTQVRPLNANSWVIPQHTTV